MNDFRLEAVKKLLKASVSKHKTNRMRNKFLSRIQLVCNESLILYPEICKRQRKQEVYAMFFLIGASSRVANSFRLICWMHRYLELSY